MNSYTDEQGAKALLDRIQAYWAERGFTIEGRIERTDFDPKVRTCRYDVRTNLVNGVPPKSARASA